MDIASSVIIPKELEFGMNGGNKSESNGLAIWLWQIVKGGSCG